MAEEKIVFWGRDKSKLDLTGQIIEITEGFSNLERQEIGQYGCRGKVVEAVRKVSCAAVMWADGKPVSVVAAKATGDINCELVVATAVEARNKKYFRQTFHGFMDRCVTNDKCPVGSVVAITTNCKVGTVCREEGLLNSFKVKEQSDRYKRIRK
jgi:hypothetical protein